MTQPRYVTPGDAMHNAAVLLSRSPSVYIAGLVQALRTIDGPERARTIADIIAKEAGN